MVQVLKFSDQIRSAIDRSGVSRYALSKRTGVTQAALCRFMQRKRGLTTETLDRLADELRMSITVDALYAVTPAGASGMRVKYARTGAHARKLKVKE